MSILCDIICCILCKKKKGWKYIYLGPYTLAADKARDREKRYKWDWNSNFSCVDHRNTFLSKHYIVTVYAKLNQFCNRATEWQIINVYSCVVEGLWRLKRFRLGGLHVSIYPTGWHSWQCQEWECICFSPLFRFAIGHRRAIVVVAEVHSFLAGECFPIWRY